MQTQTHAAIAIVDPATQWPKRQSDYPHRRGGLWRRGGHTRPRRRRPRPTAAERRRAVGGEGEEESCVVGNPPPPLLPDLARRESCHGESAVVALGSRRCPWGASRERPREKHPKRGKIKKRERDRELIEATAPPHSPALSSRPLLTAHSLAHGSIFTGVGLLKKRYLYIL